MTPEGAYVGPQQEWMTAHTKTSISYIVYGICETTEGNCFPSCAGKANIGASVPTGYMVIFWHPSVTDLTKILAFTRKRNSSALHFVVDLEK